MKPAIGAAVLGCGLFLWAAHAAAPDSVPPEGALAENTVRRLLLLDAERFGKRIVAVGDRGYIVASDDQGHTWARMKSPAGVLLTALDFVDDQAGLAVGHDSVILATRDGGQTWTQVFAAPAEQRPLLDVLFRTAQHAIAVGAYGAYYESADGARTWTARKILADDKHLNAILEVGENHLVILGEAGTIALSPDNGRTWQPVPSPYRGSLFGGLVANDGAVIAFGLRGKIFRSEDRGRSWKAVDNPSTATLMGGDKLPDGSLVIAGAGGTALVSRDDGRSFVPIATGTTRAFSKAIVGAADVVLLLGEAGPREIGLPQKR